MTTLIFSILMIAVFGRLIGFALRMTWGIFKVILTLVLLPGLIIAAFAAGLLYIAFPALAFIGLISLLSPRKRLN